jgi:hypothetical protein
LSVNFLARDSQLNLVADEHLAVNLLRTEAVFGTLAQLGHRGKVEVGGEVPELLSEKQSRQKRLTKVDEIRMRGRSGNSTFLRSMV